MKIVKHTYCKRENCSLIGKEAVIEETIPETKDKDGNVIESEWYWANVDFVLHRFQKGDLV